MVNYAHNLVAKVAQEIAGEFYEIAASDNGFYRFYPNRDFFIAREYGRFLESARIALTKMLSKKTTTDFEEDQKALIYEALLMDRALPAGRKNTRVVQ